MTAKSFAVRITACALLVSASAFIAAPSFADDAMKSDTTHSDKMKSDAMHNDKMKGDAMHNDKMKGDTMKGDK